MTARHFRLASASASSRCAGSIVDFESIKALAAGKGFSVSANLSDFSAAMLLSVLQRLSIRSNWGEMTDMEWDECDELVSRAMGEIMLNTMVGVILPTAASVVPDNMLVCDGGTVSIYDYPALAKACPELVTGATITLPDLRDRFLMGASVLHGSGGANSLALSIDNLPPHSHTYQQYVFGVDIESVGVPDPTGVGQPTVTQTTSSTGNGEPIDNRPAWYGVRYVIVAR